MKLNELANRDGLTGLFNRRHMDVQVDYPTDTLRMAASWQVEVRLRGRRTKPLRGMSAPIPRLW